LLPYNNGGIRIVVKQKMEAIIEQLEQADQLAEHHEHAEAREVLLAAQAECKRAGIESGFVSWRLSVAFDILEEYEVAFKYVQEALRLDPFAPPFRSSFGIIVGRMRKAIVAAEPGTADFVEPLYKLLVRAGEGTDAVHVAMARDFNARGESELALRLIDAVTVLSPGCRDAWLARAAICRTMGDGNAARAADIEAAALAERPKTMFAVPGPAAA
jgi:tetratricopeptide (TPR) repeat protein